ncbi:hypothetical protein [uncultured Ruminococcus sp.]|uniref:hypothetical protein n=1 Tax=uncultured Ruminococcus sp. TaxID=165186 RepID=UPI0025E8524F|nr:hypothetical protein [uncultured Ruminococcus sp.]
MTKTEAMEILSFHSCRNKNVNDPRWEFGFVGRLRPSGGELNEDNFIQIMESIRILKDDLSSDMIDKNLVYDITSIIHLTRVWCLPPSGGPNSCINARDQEQLLLWVDIVEKTLFHLLDGADDDTAFQDYDSYLQDSNDQQLKAELLRML